MIDGGKVGVDEVTNSSAKASKKDYPNILYLTGGGITSHTARSKIWSNWFLEDGYPRVFIVNKRCTSKVLQYSPQYSIPYGKYNDIPDVLDYLVEYLPGEKWIIIGSCYGAAFVLDYFSQPISHDRTEVLGGIVDSFQFDGRKFLDGHYTSKITLFKESLRIMMHLFVDLALNHAANMDVYHQVSELVDRERIRNLDLSNKNAIKIVYEEVVCKMCPDAPFDTIEEFFAMAYPYYDENHKNFLKIKKPITLIYAQDDPFSPFDLDTIETLKENPNLCLWLYAGGGHITSIEKLLPYTSFLKNVYLENAHLLMRNQEEL
jgi:predicted alpha/beta-fold hydrolase